MQVKSATSSVYSDEPQNDRVLLRNYRGPLNKDEVHLKPYRGSLSEHHIINVDLDPQDDGFCLTLLDANLGGNQKEIVVTLTGHLTNFTNKSSLVSNFTPGPVMLERKTFNILVAPNQRLIISDLPTKKKHALDTPHYQETSL